MWFILYIVSKYCFKPKRVSVLCSNLIAILWYIYCIVTDLGCLCYNAHVWNQAVLLAFQFQTDLLKEDCLAETLLIAFCSYYTAVVILYILIGSGPKGRHFRKCSQYKICHVVSLFWHLICKQDRFCRVRHKKDFNVSHNCSQLNKTNNALFIIKYVLKVMTIHILWCNLSQ